MNDLIDGFRANLFMSLDLYTTTQPNFDAVYALHMRKAKRDFQKGVSPNFGTRIECDVWRC
jgi:hypothetical protein